MSTTAVSKDESPWRNSEVLEELYIEQDLTRSEVAEELGCSVRTVSNWAKEFGLTKIQRHDGGIYSMIDEWGYEFFTDGQSVVRHHQLLAIADGADPDKVFSNGEYVTHHTTIHPFDNRPGRLQVITRGEHSRIHAEEDWSEIDGERQLRVDA